jgi:hypothetical protein
MYKNSKIVTSLNMNEYFVLKSQLEFYCEQELRTQQTANLLASTSVDHRLWLACINHQLDCFNHHEQIIDVASLTLPSIYVNQLYQLSVEHTKRIIANQLQYGYANVRENSSIADS